MEVTTPIPRKRQIIHKDVWANVKTGYEAAVPLEELSAKYSIPTGTIQVKAHRAKWVTTPRKIVKEVQRGAEMAAEMTVSEKNSSALPAITDWVDTASRYRAMIFGKVQKALEDAVAEAPKTWRDIEIADRIARKAAGLESGETTVVQTIIPIGKGDFNVERDVSPPISG